MYGPDVQRPGIVRPQLPAGPAAGRARRALRPAHARRLGPAPQPADAARRSSASDTDQPSAALVKDLKQRGLLDDTLVDLGRRVRPHGRSARATLDAEAATAATITRAASRSGWPAAASRPGISYGETDDFGYNVAEDPVHVHDFQATILHLLGIDHTRLTFKFQGRHYRLTDVHGEVVKGDAGVRAAAKCGQDCTPTRQQRTAPSYPVPVHEPGRTFPCTAD